MSNTNEQAMDVARIKAFQQEYHDAGLEPPRHESVMWNYGFEAGWNAANQHARETEQGEPRRLSIVKDLLRELLSTAYITTGAVPTMAELGFATLSLKAVITKENLLRVFEKHLTDADEPQPDHFPDITEMVQPDSPNDEAEG